MWSFLLLLFGRPRWLGIVDVICHKKFKKKKTFSAISLLCNQYLIKSVRARARLRSCMWCVCSFDILKEKKMRIRDIRSFGLMTKRERKTFFLCSAPLLANNVWLMNFVCGLAVGKQVDGSVDLTQNMWSDAIAKFTYYKLHIDVIHQLLMQTRNYTIQSTECSLCTAVSNSELHNNYTHKYSALAWMKMRKTKNRFSIAVYCLLLLNCLIYEFTSMDDSWPSLHRDDIEFLNNEIYSVEILANWTKCKLRHEWITVKSSGRFTVNRSIRLLESSWLGLLFILLLWLDHMQYIQMSTGSTNKERMLDAAIDEVVVHDEQKKWHVIAGVLNWHKMCNECIACAYYYDFHFFSFFFCCSFRHLRPVLFGEPGGIIE